MPTPLAVHGTGILNLMADSSVANRVRVGIHSVETVSFAGVAVISQDIPPFTMTDHQGPVVGLNSVGLMRDGFTSSDREEIKNLFKIIDRSGMSFQ